MTTAVTRAALRALTWTRSAVWGDREDAEAHVPGPREAVVAMLALAALAVLAYLPHLRYGGLMSDDWSNLADYRFAVSPRYLETALLEWEKLGARPLLGALLPAPAALFGDDATGQIALGLALAVATSLLLYLVARTAGAQRALAFAGAGYALLLAQSSSVRLWPAAALNHVAVLLFLGGLLCTLRAFSARGRRATALHASGLALYALSLATYEVAAIVILVLAPLYLRFASPDRVLRRAGADAALVVTAVLVSGILTREVRYVAGPLSRVADLPYVVADPVRVLAAAATPFGIPDWVALVPFVFAGAVVVRVRPRTADLRRAAAGRWGLAVLAFAVLVAAAIVPFLGTPLLPTAPGIDGRGNLLVGPLLGGLAIALTGLLGALLSLAAPPTAQRRAATALTAAGIAWLVVAGWVQTRDEQRTWRAAAEDQQQVLAALRRAVPDPPPGTFLYTFGRRTEVAPRVPVFDESWDLWGAAAVQYGDPSLQAFPLRAETRLRCSDGRVTPVDAGRADYEEFGGTRYGRAIAVDLTRAESMPIADRASCLAAERARVAASPPG